MPKHLIVLSSPSGGGKTTVTRFLLNKYPELKFSVSATTRIQRSNELNHSDYHFLSKWEFEQMIKNNELVEYEEIFGNYYGTLYSEINSLIDSGNSIVFDVDVKGALSIRKAYPQDSLLIFLEPPSKETLINRLANRKTENPEDIETRIARADWELSMKDKFDFVIINNILDDTLASVDEIIQRNFEQF